MSNNLAPRELFKYQWRAQEFLSRFTSGRQFMLINGEPVQLVYKHEIAKQIENRDCKGVVIDTVDGRQVNLSKIKKTNNEDFGKFGGKDVGQVFYQERRSLSHLNSDLRATSGHFSVLGDSYHTSEFKITPSGSKADFYTNEGTFFVSHKHGCQPRHFQQWGGITSFVDHPEVTYFVNKIRMSFDRLPGGYSAFMEITDNMLKLRAMYGVDFGGIPGFNNVDLIAQGETKIDNGCFTASKLFHNGYLPTDGYRPVLCVINKGLDRNQFDIGGARFSISPFGTRRFKQEIK